jgi:hypothetical protein
MKARSLSFEVNARERRNTYSRRHGVHHAGHGPVPLHPPYDDLDLSLRPHAAARYGPSRVLSDEAAFGLSVGEETSPLVWSTKKISSARQTGIPMSRANATRKRTRIGASR